jgi:hypothetical protein
MSRGALWLDNVSFRFPAPAGSARDAGSLAAEWLLLPYSWREAARDISTDADAAARENARAPAAAGNEPTRPSHAGDGHAAPWPRWPRPGTPAARPPEPRTASAHSRRRGPRPRRRSRVPPPRAARATWRGWSRRVHHQAAHVPPLCHRPRCRRARGTYPEGPITVALRAHANRRDAIDRLSLTWCLPASLIIASPSWDVGGRAPERRRAL